MTSVNIEANKPLAPFTTIGIGGPARFFGEARTEAEVEEVTEWARRRNLPLFVLGGGSNLLVADRGFDGLVLKVGLRGIVARRAEDGNGRVIYEVGAGEDWDAFVERTVQDMLAAGAAGARLMGGGFGGSVLGLFPPGRQPPAGAREVTPGPGARLLES